ncbi:MAG: prepilin-type N-terminal cleavage/methylation domain-containing protein [Leptolyngbya sp. SIO3F4]|nr:prepilin-type N-terminal cleavage/methylation domain-containing protein [Leptolyngbya sp. SIO3F4]
MTQSATPISNTNALAARSRSRAFTLLELVIVIVIISVTAAIAIPRMSNAGSRYSVDAAVQQLLADVNITAAVANGASQSHSIAFDASTETYELIGQPSPSNPAQNQTVDLSREPFNVNMLGVSLGDNQLDISGHGLLLETGQLTLAVGRDARRVVFTSGSASVQVVNISLNTPTDGETISIRSTDSTKTFDMSANDAVMKASVR